MTLIKICGVTSGENAAMVAGAGADWLGLNFWRESRRCVDRMRARTIAVEARRANPAIKLVGVFVNASAREIETVIEATRIDFVQLHGDESPAFARRFGDSCIKALPLASEFDLSRFSEFACPFMLVDSHSQGRGGSGQSANWELAARAASQYPKVWLAGGLGPENVAEAISRVRPYGVDVASGVESQPGVKDPEKVARFVAAVRGQT